MIFFSIMPILIGGFGNYIVPLQINCSELAYPRINNFSIWLLIFSFITLQLASGNFLPETQGAGVGWTMYPPLSILENMTMDFLIISLHLNGISSLFNAINVTITILFFSSTP